MSCNYKLNILNWMFICTIQNRNSMKKYTLCLLALVLVALSFNACKKAATPTTPTTTNNNPTPNPTPAPTYTISMKIDGTQVTGQNCYAKKGSGPAAVSIVCDSLMYNNEKYIFTISFEQYSPGKYVRRQISFTCLTLPQLSKLGREGASVEVIKNDSVSTEGTFSAKLDLSGATLLPIDTVYVTDGKFTAKYK